MPATLSASGLPRAHKCPASFALPVVREESSADAQRGTLVHEFMERVVRGENPAEIVSRIGDSEARALCEKLDLRAVPRGEPEVRLAYHTRTGVGRRLEGEGHRDYALLAHEEIAGTADLVCWEATPLRVVDWKTARWDHDVEQSRAQLELYALACARIANVDRAQWSVGVISDSGAIGWHSVVLSADDLAAIAARARETWESVERERADRSRLLDAYEPDVSLGWWCRWCSAFRACPALRREVQIVAGRFVAEVKDNDLGDAYATSKLLEKAVEAVKNTTKRALERTNALPTGDGREVIIDGRGALRMRRVA